MILAVLSGEETFAEIQSLNFRGDYDIRHISCKTLTTARKTLEAPQPFTHVLIDIGLFRENIDHVLDFIQRLLVTTQYTLCILASECTPGSRLLEDLISIGIQPDNIVLSTGTTLKVFVHGLLQRTGEQIPVPVPEPESIQEEKGQLDEGMPPEEPSSSIAVPLPSQIDYATAKKMVHKTPLIPPAKAITISIAGAVGRIGATTQALQMALWLKAHDANVLVVDLTTSAHFEALGDMYNAAAPAISTDTITINGIPILLNGKLLFQVRNAYDYIICDYGVYAAIPERIGFWEKDIKVLVAGIKPWESAALDTAFSDDTGELRYIFSFVPEQDKAAVLEQMGDSAAQTFFAEYSPDYFSYSGNDDLYAALFSTPKEATKRMGFFQRFGKRKN